MRTALGVLLCVVMFAACDKKGGNEPVHEPEQKRVPHKEPAQEPAGPTKAIPMSWEEARVIAVAHYTRTAGAEFAKRLQPHPRIKYLFTNSSDTVLVHGGAVVTATGLDVFDDLLRGRDSADLEVLTAEDLAQLVRLCEAFPPMKDHDPQRFYDDGEFPNLRPTVTWSDGVGTFRVNYRVDEGDNTEDEGIPIVEWSVLLDGKTPPQWSSRLRVYNEHDNTFSD